MGYDKKTKLVVLQKQVSNGCFDPKTHGNVGVLDVVGKDRKVAWLVFFLKHQNYFFILVCQSFHTSLDFLGKNLETCLVR